MSGWRARRPHRGHHQRGCRARHTVGHSRRAPSTSLVRAPRSDCRGLAHQGIPPVSPIIFIDDLDRCSPRRTGTPRPDPRLPPPPCRRGTRPQPRFAFRDGHGPRGSAQGGLRQYRDIERYDANRFLEKMFPLAFHVPQPTTDHIQGLLRGFVNAPIGVGRASTPWPAGTSMPWCAPIAPPCYQPAADEAVCEQVWSGGGLRSEPLDRPAP